MRVISEPGQGGKENFLGNFSRPAALPPDAVPGSSRGQGGSAMARKSKPDKKPDRRPAKNTDLVPKDYEQFLGELKDRIRTAQLRAAVSVNRELVLLYWQIGRDILARQKQHGWGAKVIEQLASDLRREFPGMEGFSPRNLKYMRAFAQAWSEEAIVQEALAQITWYHNLTLIEKLKEREERLWYVQETVKKGWSRNVLVHWIESDLYERQGKASTNFEQSMPRRQSDLARELLKDPYDFQFLATAREAEEREIEQGLVAHIREFLLELVWSLGSWLIFGPGRPGWSPTQAPHTPNLRLVVQKYRIL